MIKKVRRTGRREQKTDVMQKLNNQLNRTKDQYARENLQTVMVNGLYSRCPTV